MPAFCVQSISSTLGSCILPGCKVQSPAQKISSTEQLLLPFVLQQEPPCLTMVSASASFRPDKRDELNPTQQHQPTDPSSWDLLIKSWHWWGRGKPGSGREVLTSCIVGPTGYSARTSQGQSDKRQPRPDSQSIRASGGIWGKAPQLLRTTESALLRKKEHVTMPQACQELLGSTIPPMTPQPLRLQVRVKLLYLCHPRFLLGRAQRWLTQTNSDKWPPSDSKHPCWLPSFNTPVFCFLPSLLHSNVLSMTQGKHPRNIPRGLSYWEMFWWLTRWCQSYRLSLDHGADKHHDKSRHDNSLGYRDNWALCRKKGSEPQRRAEVT
jgi:hypothetical protein